MTTGTAQGNKKAVNFEGAFEPESIREEPLETTVSFRRRQRRHLALFKKPICCNPIDFRQTLLGQKRRNSVVTCQIELRALWCDLWAIIAPNVFEFTLEFSLAPSCLPIK